MRVTNTMMSSNFMRNLNNNMVLLNKYQHQLATNRRLTKLSDDPTGVIQSMTARVKLYRLDQYQRNVSDAKTWQTQVETSLTELSKVLVTAYENAVQIKNDYYTESSRESTGALIAELRDHIIELGNTQMGDRYLFGGYNTTQKPFTVDDDGKVYYNGVLLEDVTDPANLAKLDQEAGERIQFEIGYGMLSDVTINGIDLMGRGENNMYNVLNDFYNVLMDPDTTAEDISPFVTKLQNLHTDTVSSISETGGKLTRLDLAADRYENDIFNYTTIKSQVEDVNEAEAIMYYKMAEAVYTASLQVGAQILQPSLVDFLR